MGNKKIKEVKINKVKHKLITLYAVVNADDINSEGICDFSKTESFYTVTDNYDDCEEYISTREICDHMEHYTMWCTQRNLNPFDDNNWDTYKDIVIGDACDYAVITFQILWEDIIAFIRMFQNCYPINCSFDRDIEKVYFKNQLNDMLKKTLKEDNLEDLFEEHKINPKDIIQ